MFFFAPKEFSVSCNKTSFLGETFHSYYEKVVFINEIGILLLNRSRNLVKAGNLEADRKLFLTATETDMQGFT